MLNDKSIAELHNLNIVCEDAYILALHDNEAFCKLRRTGFGGSDSGVLLGVNKWKTFQQLVDEKATDTVTEEELKVGKLPQVRKGADLEPIILNKAAEALQTEIYKPSAMYQIENTRLNINFDGIIEVEGKCIPVEAKYVSPYAGKHWGWKCAGTDYKHTIAAGNLQQYVNEAAEAYGIPPYYFTQLQQEMLGLSAEYGYLAALYDYDWNLYLFKVYRDQYVQQQIIEYSEQAYTLIQNMKGIK